MKAIRISDIELMDIDPNSDSDVTEATADINPEPATVKFDKQPPSPFNQYIDAFKKGDIDTLEQLRKQHPDDARFNYHLNVLGIGPEQTQEFADIKKKHDELLKALGIDGVAEFHRMLDSGNKEKATKFVQSLRKDHPLKDAMTAMLKYI